MKTKFMNLTKIKNVKLDIHIPIFGIGCGVLGMSLAKKSIALGKYASTLLKALEYRGYDSTGAAFQKEDGKVTLLKDVGAPSTLVETLGIKKENGKIFCGQVRWATFGTVTKKNAQPHIVKCKRFIYGAHNGNITNTRELKHFLLAEGHNVVSDNDGEMLVHTVEHCFNIFLNKEKDKDQNNIEIRKKCMRNAIILASKKLVGSYAAVIVDPVTEHSYAIKAGSSLYFGVGIIDNNKFCLAASDLTAVLRFTKNLLNIREGEFIEFHEDIFNVFAFKDLKIKRPNQSDLIIKSGEKIEKKLVRSKLRAEDTELLPPYKYFMEQEIYAEVESAGKVVKIFQGGSNSGKSMINLLTKEKILKDIEELSERLLGTSDFKEQLSFFNEFYESKKANEFYDKIKQNYSIIYDELVKKDFEKKYFFSSDMNTFIELLNAHFDKKKLLIAKALDSISEKVDIQEFNKSIKDFLEIIKNTDDNNGNIYTIACGTSFHATKVASLFFNEIAHTDLITILPGDFRGQYSHSLKDDDVIIGVSQSGETKDLIDIFNDVEASGLKVKKIVIANNMNSTLGQEKSDVAIPINCGPEISVPATKSFVNQITLFYYLAIKVAKMKLRNSKNEKAKAMIAKREKSIELIPGLIKETIETTQNELDIIASKLYLEASIHIAATKITGVAKEGALKIRETVLNHTEGGEASEFKHGPNTILGKNTVFGIKNVKGMFKDYTKLVGNLYEETTKGNIENQDFQKMLGAMSNRIFKRAYPFNLSGKANQVFEQKMENFDFFQNGYRNYPLIYITGPDERDVNLTISQINTHKIRGGDSFIIAEENDKLLENAKDNPHDEGYYGWGYVILPKTGDAMMTVFSSTVALQLLALKMSIRKMEYLDKLGIKDHGVHPDVPKNVSKSITVD